MGGAVGHTCPLLLALLQRCQMGWCIPSSASQQHTAVLTGMVYPSVLASALSHSPCPDLCGCLVSLDWPQGVVTLGRQGSRQPGRVAEPPGSAREER